MLRLGRLDHGTVRTLAGEELRVGHPVEIELALRSAATVEGYLGLLAEFVRTQSEPSGVLRSLVAPGMGSQEFKGVYAALESAWASCR